MEIPVVGGSDAGISAALRAREVAPDSTVTMVVADAYPDFSVCGIPYDLSGEVPDRRDLAHRTAGEIEATGIQVRVDHTVRRPTPAPADGSRPGSAARPVVAVLRDHRSANRGSASGTIAFAYEMGVLKRLRHAGRWHAGVRDPESVSEHSLRVAQLAALIATEEGGDPARAASMGMWHDSQETRIGDVPHSARPYVEVATQAPPSG